MKQLMIVGVDVSKSTLDLLIKPLDHVFKIANDVRSFKTWLKQVNALLEPGVRLLVVMEHTGKYSFRFEMFLKSKLIDYCKVPALEIKRSIGMIRGKNDTIDARRIAEYAWLRRDVLVAQEPINDVIVRLKDLLSLRQKLVKDRSGYICRLKEIKTAGQYSCSDTVVKTQTCMISFLNAEIKKVESAIKMQIEDHQDLKHTYDLVTSIKGVGFIIAAYMIGCTNNFKSFTNARKFNCYAGLAPFTNQSGTSLRSKDRLSHLANKEVKTLLNLGASTAIQHDPELKAYYQKRVAEGKRKMSCLNIIRSKLVARMFAVIKRQTPYQPIAA